jgi:pimeloyl-ACP methyl ester carboxylesterase
VSRVRLLATVTSLAVWLHAGVAAQTAATVIMREHRQSLWLFGPSSGDPVIVSSGDGGWIHVAPHVAEMLASRGFFVVGFDTKAYLSSFTTGKTSLSLEDEPADYAVLADFATRQTGKKPILIGVSEGAGLSVLAASDPRTKERIAGVVALGLPDQNELGWRLLDSMIYFTHRAPREPTFSTAAIVDRMTPVPLAAIHSTKDEYVPLAEAQRVLDAAREPKRLWIVQASDHRFSDNPVEFERCVVEAIRWVGEQTPR